MTGVFQPYPYQQYCIQRIIQEPSIGLFIDMGLGKTVVTLTAIRELRLNMFQVSKPLVIAPKKVAESTWDDEARKWEHLKFMRISHVLGGQKQRIRALNTPADLYVINRDNVSWLVGYYKNVWPFDMVIIDESTSFKSHRAGRFKSLTWVRKYIQRMVLLTGTPSPNGLMDLWAQLFLLDGGQRLGKSITSYREAYFHPDKRDRNTVFSYALEPWAENVIQQRIGDICISMKAEDYLTLPDMVVDDVPVVLDEKSRRSYEKLERDMLLEVDEGTIDAGSAAVLTNKLLQLCNGAVYDSEKNVLPVHDCKIEAFKELIEKLNGQPALVFYSFKHDVPRIYDALKGFELRVRELKTAEDQRAWNERQVDILLAHPASAGYGLNLQAGGNHVVWFGLTWSLEQYLQANKRLHRQGQKSTVIVHRMAVKNSVDEDVIYALEGKNEAQERLISALKARIREVKG